MVYLNDHSIELIVDTGATANINSQETHDIMPKKAILSGPMPKVFAYESKAELPLLGKFTAQVSYKGAKIQDTALVTSTPSESLLRFKSAEARRLASTVYITLSLRSLQDDRPSLFEGLRKLQGIEVKTGIVKFVSVLTQMLMPIQFSVQDAVTIEVERLKGLM